MTHTRNTFVPSGIPELDKVIDLQLDNLRRAEFGSVNWHAAENQLQGIRTALACIDRAGSADCVTDVAEAITDIELGRPRREAFDEGDGFSRTVNRGGVQRTDPEPLRQTRKPGGCATAGP